MDKDRVKGAIDDAVGRARRQAGEWTGDTESQVKGAAQQIKGKAEKVVGNLKDAARDARTDADKERPHTTEAQRERDNAERDHATSTPHRNH